MIKLTVLYYEVKSEVEEKIHNLQDHHNQKFREWEQELEFWQNIGGEQPVQPYSEPYEFQEEDYNITERQMRVRLEDIYSYREAKDGVREIKMNDGEVFNVKETLEYLDKLFGV